MAVFTLKTFALLAVCHLYLKVLKINDKTKHFKLKLNTKTFCSHVSFCWNFKTTCVNYGMHIKCNMSNKSELIHLVYVRGKMNSYWYEISNWHEFTWFESCLNFKMWYVKQLCMSFISFCANFAHIKFSYWIEV